MISVTVIKYTVLTMTICPWTEVKVFLGDDFTSLMFYTGFKGGLMSMFACSMKVASTSTEHELNTLDSDIIVIVLSALTMSLVTMTDASFLIVASLLASY